MPYTMTHLYIAKNLYKSSNIIIKDLSQFYLGAIAPDAVRNRDNYKLEDEKISHLFAREEGREMFANNEGIEENVINFLLSHKNSPYYDFVLGYCVHILSDVYHHIAVWKPFIKKYLSESLELKKLYKEDNEKIDIELALMLDKRDDVWYYLEKSKAISLDNIIFENEIEIQKENVLNHLYKDKDKQDVSSNKIITIQSTIEFIEDTTKFIIDKLACLD